MARNRMIKPEFWSSETLNKVSLQARLSFIGIWNFCDDYGFCLDNSRSILGDVFPLDEKIETKQLSKWIDELIEQSLLIKIEYCGKKLLYVRGWDEHQTVQHKSRRSFVEPDDIEELIKVSLESHESVMRVSRESHAPKRKKKEKEEREKAVEEIYQKYPRKVGKLAALNAIEKALKEMPAEELAKRVDSFAISVKFDDPKFIPHPATWFNQGRYMDDLKASPQIVIATAN